MSAIKAEAVDALVDDNYELALELFDKAVKADPKDFELYIGRAAAYIKLENFLKAITDAKTAIELNPENHRGYLKKGEAAFQLEEYESAQEAFKKALEKGGPEAKIKTFLRKCQAELDDEGFQEFKTPQVPFTGKDAAKATDSKEPPTEKPTVQLNASTTQPEIFSEASSLPFVAPNQSSAAAAAVQPKYRHQFYQTQTVMEVAILAKNLTPERINIEVQERQLSVTILDTSGQQEYAFHVELFGRVVPAESKYELLRTKVEIRLAKADPIQWPSLEATTSAPLPNITSRQPPTAPAYPTSFKRRPVDWDKLEADLKKEEKDEKLEGDAALQKLFQGIYANADEDTRRAMNKSFQESNGTVLSTNWKEIGSKKTEYKSPSD